MVGRGEIRRSQWPKECPQSLVVFFAVRFASLLDSVQIPFSILFSNALMLDLFLGRDHWSSPFIGVVVVWGGG